MKQKLEDLKLALRHDRRVWAGAALCFFVFLLWSFSSSPRKQRRPGAEIETATSMSPSESEGFSDLLRAFRNELDDVITVSRNNQDALERMEKEKAASEDRTRGTLEAIVERMEAMDQNIKELDSQPRPEPVAGQVSNDPLAQDIPVEPQSAAPFGFDKDTVPPPPPPPKEVRVKVVSTGDSVPVELLTGVAAPTDGTPYPTVFRLLGPVVGPDGSSLDLGEARLVAAAQGSETDGRVLYRLTDLAIRHRDGRRSVVKVDGWVVGEDGIRGMKGFVIDKLGQVIAATAGVSFAAALGERVTNRSSSIPLNDIIFDRNGRPISRQLGVTVTGSDVDVATASALTDASNRLGQLLLEKYEKLIPVVEVRSGRKVAAVFSTTSEIEIIEDEADESIYAVSALD